MSRAAALALWCLAGCAHPQPPASSSPADSGGLMAALSRDPNNRAINWQLGQLSERQGDFMRAEQYYERAEILGQPSSDTAPAIIRVLVAAQRYDEALLRCRKRLSDDPTDRATRFVAAALLQAQNRVDEAERELNQLVRTEPRDPEPYVALARLYRDDRRNPARARALFEQSLPLVKDEAQARRLRYELEELPPSSPSSDPANPPAPLATPAPTALPSTTPLTTEPTHS